MHGTRRRKPAGTGCRGARSPSGEVGAGRARGAGARGHPLRARPVQRGEHEAGAVACRIAPGQRSVAAPGPARARSRRAPRGAGVVIPTCPPAGVEQRAPDLLETKAHAAIVSRRAPSPDGCAVCTLRAGGRGVGARDVARQEFEAKVRGVIRRCARGDLPALEWHGAFRHHRELIAAAFERQRRGEVVMLVADVGGWPVAQAWLDLTRRAAAGACFVWALRVVPRLRGAGLGTLLLDAAEREARARGFVALELGVEARNLGARRLYERRGFRAVERVREAYAYTPPGGRREELALDEWFLRKPLTRGGSAAPRPRRARRRGGRLLAVSTAPPVPRPLRRPLRGRQRPQAGVVARRPARRGVDAGALRPAPPGGRGAPRAHPRRGDARAGVSVTRARRRAARGRRARRCAAPLDRAGEVRTTSRGGRPEGRAASGPPAHRASTGAGSGARVHKTGTGASGTWRNASTPGPALRAVLTVHRGRARAWRGGAA